MPGFVGNGVMPAMASGVFQEPATFRGLGEGRFETMARLGACQVNGITKVVLAAPRASNHALLGTEASNCALVKPSLMGIIPIATDHAEFNAVPFCRKDQACHGPGRGSTQINGALPVGQVVRKEAQIPRGIFGVGSRGVAPTPGRCSSGVIGFPVRTRELRNGLGRG
jgi:hypothetical protein